VLLSTLDRLFRLGWSDKQTLEELQLIIQILLTGKGLPS